MIIISVETHKLIILPFDVKYVEYANLVLLQKLKTLTWEIKDRKIIF